MKETITDFNVMVLPKKYNDTDIQLTTIVFVLTALVRRKVTKDGFCPRLTYVNFDHNECITAKCEDDGDCAGDGKCCMNPVCNGMTCARPLGMYHVIC